MGDVSPAPSEAFSTIDPVRCTQHHTRCSRSSSPRALRGAMCTQRLTPHGAYDAPTAVICQLRYNSESRISALPRRGQRPSVLSWFNVRERELSTSRGGWVLCSMLRTTHPRSSWPRTGCRSSQTGSCACGQCSLALGSVASGPACAGHPFTHQSPKSWFAVVLQGGALRQCRSRGVVEPRLSPPSSLLPCSVTKMGCLTMHDVIEVTADDLTVRGSPLNFSPQLDGSGSVFEYTGPLYEPL
jgi:hypothetical protein